MREYLDLVKTILSEGKYKENRTGVDTISYFSGFHKVDLSDGFPLLTTKKMTGKRWNSLIYELLWFISGEDHIRNLSKHTKIWDAWADEDGEIGPVYGRQWRKYKGVTYKTNEIVEIDQLKNAIDRIKNKPNDRRIIVTAWNPAQIDDAVSYDYKKTTPRQFTVNDLNGLVNGYASYTMRVYDKEYGGFGGGQKFPQGRTLDFALELYELTNDPQWLNLVKNTLNNQYTSVDELSTNYNLFDPVEGGFHRYGTQRDWTPPHYEKMLYDNARLLKAYYHLKMISPDDIVDEVVDKTLMFIEQNWYDPKGGFYGNSDVHGEDAYYGKSPRPDNKPRVEETKYTDWNSEAILTYLYLFQASNEVKYKEMAEKSLDFFTGMIGKDGAYHYYRDGEMGVTGSLLDNSYLLLAFVEGYTVLRKENYLNIAINLADYSLESLYDWNSGGFFERNSNEKNIYASGDNVRLSKPGQENGIIAYAMLKLYKITNNELYLNAAMKTMGDKFDSIGGLDRGYYFIKSAQFILQNNLLNEFNSIDLSSIEKEKQDNFWLNDLLNNDKKEFVASQKGIETFEGSFLLLLIIALIAGFVSFASPCSLPILPAYVAYSFKSSKQNIKGMTIAFFLGLSLIFTVIGMSTTAIGLFLRHNLMLFSQIAGIAIILFGIYILTGGGFSGFKIKQKKPTSYFGSFLFGSALGISWTPCVGPILVALLLVASTVGSVAKGGILLFVYSIGLALPLILISMYIEKLNKKSKLWKMIQGKELKVFGKKIHSTTLVSGLLFIILGYLIFSGLLYSFNQYITVSGFQKVMFNIEGLLLELIR